MQEFDLGTEKVNIAKFGGSSVAHFEAMQNSAQIVRNNPGTRVVVISACSGVTDLLVQLSKGLPTPKITEIMTKLRQIHYQIIDCFEEPEPVKFEIDELLATVEGVAVQAQKGCCVAQTDHLVAHGELLSTRLFNQVFKELGVRSVWFDVRQIMRTDNSFNHARPDLKQLRFLATKYLMPLLKDYLVITQGFIGCDGDQNTTTLGRGGSDYSASLLAEALNADTLEIWTDVPGIYTTDPRIVANAKRIDEISFSEASEMANFGAKILHPATLIPAIRQQIPVFVGSSKNPNAGGTWVCELVKQPPLFRAVTLRRNQTMVTLTSLNMYHTYGFLAKVFTILADNEVSVDLITTSEISVALTLDSTDTSGDAPKLPALALLELEKLSQVKIEYGLSLVALIGNNMNEHRGLCSQVFSALQNVNVRTISSGASPHNFCLLLSESDAIQAVQALHDTLF